MGQARGDRHGRAGRGRSVATLLRKSLQPRERFACAGGLLDSFEVCGEGGCFVDLSGVDCLASIRDVSSRCCSSVSTTI